MYNVYNGIINNKVCISTNRQQQTVTRIKRKGNRRGGVNRNKTNGNRNCNGGNGEELNNGGMNNRIVKNK